MSGHSKWSTIKRKKGANDAARAKVFTKLAREISVAVKEGGADPNNNARLRDLLAKGRAANVPQDNLMRAIKKAEGDDKTNYESIVYEGYGPNGIAVIVETLTDNRNRSISEVRMAFERNNGNMAGSGAVARMFQRQAHFVITGEWADEDKLMEITLDAGADDLVVGDGEAEIWADPENFEALVKALELIRVNIVGMMIIRHYIRKNKKRA